MSRKVTAEPSQLILDRLSRIENKVDSIEQTNAFALRPDAEKYFQEVRKVFGRSIRSAQIYLAANGSKSVQEIAEYLGMQRQNVGRGLRHLSEEGLLELVGSDGHKDIWGKKPIDRTLRITKFLRDEFGLSADGRELAISKKTTRKTRTKQSPKPRRK